MTRPTPTARRLRLPATVAACAILTACQTETRVIDRGGGMLATLPGASGGGVAPRSPLRADEPNIGLPGGASRTELPDGSILLSARTGRQLMGHIVTTLRNNERELFVQQVLSARTRQEFHDRGFDPELAFDELQRRQRWIDQLFARMPQGEFTPGVLLHRQGDRVYRMTVTGMATRDLRWTYMDMVMEDGSWRLRWFGRE